MSPALGPRADLGGAAPDDLVAVELPAEAIDPEAVARLGASFAFDARGGPGGGEAVYGVGEAARVEVSGPERWAQAQRRCEAIAEGLRGPAARRVRFVGGVTFAPDGPGTFVLPRWTLVDDGVAPRAWLVARAREVRLPSIEDEAAAVLSGAARNRGSLRELPRSSVLEDGAKAFAERVEAALASIARGDAEKIVVGRRVRIQLDAPADVATVWARIRESEPAAVGLLWRAGEAALVAASPERLVVRRGGAVVADALAGTSPRFADDLRDQASRRELLASDKDRREHEVVARTVEAALRAAGARTELSGPQLRSLRTLHHLATEVRGHFEIPPHVLSLAAALHPTPAVAGAPTAAALGFLAQHEPDRGWFTGALGWFDAFGQGAFAVVLRAARLEKLRAELFAGTGIVRGSEPARELAETYVKLAAARRALGLDEASP